MMFVTVTRTLGITFRILNPHVLSTHNNSVSSLLRDLGCNIMWLDTFRKVKVSERDEHDNILYYNEEINA